jgi:tetratricopeptide (TPR) repeat protein
MPPSSEPDPRRLELESLEQRLRALPLAAVPNALPSKLVAAIPAAKAAGYSASRVPEKWPWIAGVGAMCIIGGAIIYSALIHSNPPGAANLKPPATGSSASAAKGPTSSPAILEGEKTVSRDPYNADAWFNLAKAQADLGRSADAVSSAEKALDVARSRNRRDLQTTIESWLRSHRPTGIQK